MRPARPLRGSLPTTTDSSATEEEYRMSPQHHTPGANAEAAAARVGNAGSPPAPSAPDENASSPAVAPEAESGTPPTGETAAAPPPPSAAAARTPEAPEEGLAVAAAVGTVPPGVKAGTGVDSGRPRKPILAGAAIVGAALIAIPLLLAGGAKDEGQRTAKGLAAEGSETVLNPDSAPAAPDDYVAKKPSSSPSKEKPKTSEAPKAPTPKRVVPAPEPKTSSPPEKKPTKPTPKAAPKPNWGTQTVFAESVLAVNQAWTTNRIRMIMQTDGNLVVYNENGKPIWASNTLGDNHRAIFQPDGNLVIYDASDRVMWASNSDGYWGARLVLRADAEVAIVYNGSVVWST
ncbi:mannose-binding protein [Streptomyces sp. NPDC054841]